MAEDLEHYLSDPDVNFIRRLLTAAAQDANKHLAVLPEEDADSENDGDGLIKVFVQPFNKGGVKVE